MGHHPKSAPYQVISSLSRMSLIASASPCFGLLVGGLFFIDLAFRYGNCTPSHLVRSSFCMRILLTICVPAWANMCSEFRWYCNFLCFGGDMLYASRCFLQSFINCSNESSTNSFLKYRERTCQFSACFSFGF